MAAETSAPSRLARLLAMAGAIPFLAGAALLLAPAGWRGFELTAFAASGLVVWSLVILAFMAGTFWGMAVTGATGAPGGEGAPPVLLVGSNLAAIIAWLAAMLLPPPAALLAFALGFLALLPLDRAALRLGLVGRGYWRLRLAVTLVVAATLAATGIAGLA